MINLAYDTQCDHFIEKELTRCGIPIVATDERPHSDVPYTRIGQLGPFTFRRFWYYWSVKGIVPIQVARELYEHTVGKTDIRVGGHCGCPSPDEYATQHWDADGKILLDREEEAGFQHNLKSFEDSPETYKRFKQAMEQYHFVDDPAAEAVVTGIENYHIDSELGLYLFVDALKRHGLVS